MTAPVPSTMRRDIASAYLAAATKIGSWVIVSAIAYRWYGAPTFAMVSLVRATLSILNYTTLGLAPAMVNMLAPSIPSALTGSSHADTPRTLSYASPQMSGHFADAIFFNGMIAGGCGFVVATILVILYTVNFQHLHQLPASPSLIGFGAFVITFGLGAALRLFSDVPGATLQTAHRMTLDYVLQSSADVVWILLCLLGERSVAFIGVAYLLSASTLFLARLTIAWWSVDRGASRPPIVAELIGRLLWFGGAVTIAQLADYLYAPIDFVLINRLLDPVLAAEYSPAVQIDAGLLLLVGGIASVLLPKTALAHAAGNVALIRKYYLRGTLFSGSLLAISGVVVWLLSPWVFRLWLNDPMTSTQAILPLVLVHTVVGGSSAVGRSVLLGTGKVKSFTLAVLLAGVVNVILSYCFVRYAGLGLRGIVLGTIVVVVARCAIWQPWYVLRNLKRMGELPTAFPPENAQTTC